MTFSPGTDFEDVTDGLEAVTLDRRGSSSDVSITHALRRAVAHKEVEASNGLYRAGDTRWHLPQAECAARPGLGDVIEDADAVRWVVIAVTDATLSSRWACVSRNLATSFGLDDVIVIEKAASSKGTAGAVERTWITYRTVRARIQPDTSEAATDTGAAALRKTYRIFIAENLALAPQYRLKDQEGNYYRVLSSTGAEQVGLLQTIIAEAW